MQNIMAQMIEAAAPRVSEKGYTCERRETAAGEVSLTLSEVNTNSKNNQLTRRWQLNGKPIAAAKLATLEA